MYNEVYFSYPEELNDPLDLGAELVISKGSYFVYEYFLLAALNSVVYPRGKTPTKKLNDIAKNISAEYSKKTRNIKELFLSNHKSWLQEQLGKNNFAYPDFDHLYNNLLNIISNLFPNQLLSVSFSKGYKNPLLWSLYADAHCGYCMIFSPSKNSINIRDSVTDKFNEYTFDKVHYGSDIDVDLSLMFNDKNEFEWKSLYDNFFPELIKKALLTKNSNWLKENELRIHKGIGITFSPLPSEERQLTPFERTCYYDPSQLIGVILGYKMKSDKRNEIIKIFSEKKQSSKIFEAIPFGNNISVQLIESMFFK